VEGDNRNMRFDNSTCERQQSVCNMRYAMASHISLIFCFKGKKKKGKTKIPMPIATKEEGARTEGGNPPEEFVVRHIHFTDNTRFNRDLPPTHPLQDDSAW